MSTPDDRRDAWRFLAVVAGLNVALAWLFVRDRAPGTGAAWQGLPLDDAWIHLVYARAVALTGRFEYNPGQPETGFTSPLWIFALAPWMWLKRVVDLPVVAVVKALGTAFGIVACRYTHRLAHALSGRRDVAWVAGLVVALDPLVGFARVSGMEVTLAASMALVAAVAVVEGDVRRAGVAMALASLARPESLVLAGLGFLVMARALRERRGAMRDWGWLVAPSALALGLWALFCLDVTGRLLPATFYAKHHAPSLLDHFDDVAESVRMLVSAPWLAWGAGVALAAAGAWVTVRRAEASARWGHALVAAYPWLSFVALVWAHHVYDGHAFYWSRYLAPTLPFWAVLFAVGAVAAFEKLRAVVRGDDRAPRVMAFATVGGALLVASVVTWPTRLLEASHRYAWNCQNIEEMEVALGRWVRAHAAPTDLVATVDAGAIRYFGHRPVLDMEGLNHHAVLDRGLFTVMTEARPRFVIYFPVKYPRLAESPEFRVVHRVRTAHYTIFDGRQDEMLVLERR